MTAEYTLQHRIAGDACDAAQGEWFEKFEPCTGHLLARVAAGTGADVDRAVRAARAEFDGGSWRRLPGAARAKLLNRLADLLEHDAERFVELLAREQGARDGSAHDGPADVDRHTALLRRMGGQARRPPDSDRRLHGAPDRQLHGARSSRRRRPDRAVECAADDRVLETGARARGRLHGRDQAIGGRAARGRGAGGPGGAGWFSARCRESRARHRCVGRGRAGQSPGRRQDQLYRQHRGRPHDRARSRRTVQAADAGTRRQGAADHLRRRESRAGDRRRRDGAVRQPGADMRGRHARAGAAPSLRRRRRRASACGAVGQGRHAVRPGDADGRADQRPPCRPREDAYRSGAARRRDNGRGRRAGAVARLLRAADGVRECRSGDAHRARRSVRAGRHDHAVRYGRRGRRAGERHRLRVVRHAVDPRSRDRAPYCRPSAGRRGRGERVVSARRTAAVGRLQGERRRARPVAERLDAYLEEKVVTIAM